MDRSSELAKALSKTLNYTKALKLNVAMQPLQQSSETILSHDYPLQAAAFNKSKKKESGVFSREGSPRRWEKQRREEKDAFNLSCKYPVLKKEFQSQNERDPAFNRTSDKVQIKHLTNLLGASVGSKQLSLAGKKSGHSYTYTHLNDDSDKFSDADNTFYRPQHKLRHSKSPSKERHIEHNNTSYADEPQKRPPLVRFSSRGQDMGMLLRQINRLQEVIASYESVLMRMKQKYLQLQGKLVEKAANDHHIDVLKKKIQQMQENNSRMARIIHSQRQTISKFQKLMVERIGLLRQHYEKEIQTGLQMARENDFLKKIMLIAINPQSPQHSPPKTSSSSSSQQNSFLRSLSKGIEEFNSKWK